MNIKTHLSILTVLGALWVPRVTQAAPEGILANSGRFKPSVSVSDSYSEKLVKVMVSPATPAEPEFDIPAMPAEYAYEVQVQPEKLSAKVVANLADASGLPAIDFAGINEGTEVSISVGDFAFSSTLGDAASKRIGRTGSATFYFEQSVLVLDSRGNPRLDAEGMEMYRTVRVGSVVFSWNERSKNVSATFSAVIPAGGAGEDSGLVGFGADAYTEITDPETGGTVRFANEPVTVGIGFAGLTGSREAFVAGSATTKVTRVRVDPADPSLDEYYPVSSVTIAGAADVAGPTLSVRTPTRADANGEALIVASIADRPAPVYTETEASDPTVEVYVNDPLFESPAGSLEYDDPNGLGAGLDFRGRGTVSGTIGSDSLTLSKNSVVIVATDSEGNQTVVRRVITAVPVVFEQF